MGRLGRIVAGPEAGRVMEVVDDAQGSGGFLIVTYGDANRSGEVEQESDLAVLSIRSPSGASLDEAAAAMARLLEVVRASGAAA